MITESKCARAYDLKRHFVKLKHERFDCFFSLFLSLFHSESLFVSLSFFAIAISIFLLFFTLSIQNYLSLILTPKHTTLKIKRQTNTYCESARKRLKVNMRFEHSVDSFLMFFFFVAFIPICENTEEGVRCSTNTPIAIFCWFERMFDA